MNEPVLGGKVEVIDTLRFQNDVTIISSEITQIKKALLELVHIKDLLKELVAALPDLKNVCQAKKDAQRITDWYSQPK